MQLDDIKASVRPTMRAEIDGLFGTFIERLGTDDLDRFVSWLHDEGHISAQTFRGLHAGGKLVLTSFETLSESTYYPDEIEREELLDEFDPTEHAEEGDAQRYQFLGKLAAGAMGEIHVVRDRELQRKVALKKMHASIARKAKLARRFLNEAQITAQLDHPNIVPVYTLDASKDKPLSYTMKLIRGNTFAQVIEETQAFYDENRALDDDHGLATRLDHFVRACDALSYAHSRGVVHRDLKPENIMVGAYGEVYVMDWGIARIMGQAEEAHDGADGAADLVELGSSSVQQTRFGAVLGTPAYMSPEQAAGLNDVLDGRSDGYSLGLILRELVCLKPAVSGGDTMAILDRMQDGKLDPIEHHSARENIAPELIAIIEKATSRRPDDRYQTVKELAEDVRRFQRGEPVRALPEGPLQRLYRWISRHRELVLSVALFAFMFAGALTIASLASTLFTLRRGTMREQRISQLLSEVSRRGHVIDTRFQGYQALLRVLSASALEASTRSDEQIGDGWYITAELANDASRREQGFQDLTPSSVYGRPVSLDFPTTSVAPGADGGNAELAARRLSLLRLPLRRAMLESHDPGKVALDDQAARALLVGEVSPVRWAYVALESGVGITYPGHEGVPPGLDMRREPWYQAVAGLEGPVRFAPVWGNPHLDDAGNDTLLPVSMGIYDDKGVFVGVAALEVGFSYIQDNLLSLPGLEHTEAFVLDEQGRILMSTREEADTSTQSVLRTRSLRRKKFEIEAVTQAVAERVGGTMEVPGVDGQTDLVIWTRMGDLGWTYLVQGPRNELMR